MAEPAASEIRRSSYTDIPIDKIKPSRHQARKAFDEEGIKELAESIKQEGLIEPVVVRRTTPSPSMGDHRSDALVDDGQASTEHRSLGGGDGGGHPPPLSSPTGGEDVLYELIAGERRWPRFSDS